jgi:hypothetical protein
MEVGCGGSCFKVALGFYVFELLGCLRMIFVDLLVFCDECGGGVGDRRNCDR